MIKGTTPTFTLSVSEDSGVDFTNADNIYFTIKQGNIQYTKTNADIEIFNQFSVGVTLSQEETLSFHPNIEAEIQLNWTYNNLRAATEVKKIKITKNLLLQVVE